MKGDLRVAVYGENNGCVTFYKDTLDKFNFSAYIKLWGKGTRLYFLPSTPMVGTKIGETGKVQVSRPEIADVLKGFKGTHKLLFDDVTHYYYIDKDKSAVEEQEQEQEQETKTERKPEKPKEPKEPRVVREKKTVSKDAVGGVLMGCLYECIDNDDLAGAKALLKAIRKVQVSKCE